jgi:recombination protein RecT
MGNPNTALAVAPVERFKIVSARLAKEQGKLAQLLPAHLPVERFVQIVQNALIRQPALLACDANSIVRVCSQSAELGLELGGALGESYIVPFWNAKKRSKVATFIAGYKGLIKLALDNPKIELIEARLVHAADSFDVLYGTNPSIMHKPMFGKGRGGVIAAYCRAQFSSGASQFEVMDESELEAIESDVKRRLRDNFYSSPWASNSGQHREEMLRKCPIRKIAKTLTLSAGLKKAIEIEMQNEGTGNRVNDSLGGDRTEALKEKLKKIPVNEAGEYVPSDAAIDAEWEPGDDDESEGT